MAHPHDSDHLFSVPDCKANRPKEDELEPDSSGTDINTDTGTDTDTDISSEHGTSKTTQRRRKTVEELLDNVLCDLKTGEKTFDQISNDIKAGLEGDTGLPKKPTALHILADTTKDELPLPKILRPLVEFLVRSPRRLLVRQDENARLTPLHLAILQRNNTMVKWMCLAYKENGTDGGVDEVLAIKSLKNENCLHLATQEGVWIAEFLIDLASANTLCQKNGEGNTPLHLAVEHKRCDEKQLDLVRAIVDKCDDRMRCVKDGDFNNDSRSPYRHHLFTCEEAEMGRTTMEDLKREKGRAESDSNVIIPRQMRRSTTCVAGKLYGEDTQQREQRTPSRYTSIISQRPSMNTSEQHHSRPGFDNPIPDRANGRPSFIKDGPTRQVPEPRTEAKYSKSNADTNAQSQTSAIYEIRRFLKTHYLRARSHDVALEILYGRVPTPENPYKSIFLDLSGFPNISKAGVQNTISFMELETVLQFVDIPKIKEEAAAPNAANSKKIRRRPNKPDGLGRSGLIDVLGSLSGVDTILKLTVDDLEQPAHSDVAIEMALEGKAVEIWDWRKIDICSEVIRRSAPNVREVNLYWSGQNAVLRGWSEKEGLPQLNNLEKIELHIGQGLEPQSRMQADISEFMKRVTRHFMKLRARELATEKLGELIGEVTRALSNKNDMVRYMGLAKEICDKMVREVTGDVVGLKRKAESAPMTKNAARELLKERAKMLAGAVASSQDNRNAVIHDTARQIARLTVQDIILQTPNLNIIPHYHPTPQGFIGTAALTSPLPSGPSGKPRQHQWIKSMREFKCLLFSAEANLDGNKSKDEKLSPESRTPIVVALIDDGVDLQSLYPKSKSTGQITGHSFFSRPSDPHRPIPFYESTGGHGTVMGAQIQRICPWAHLHVLKLQDHTDPETGERRITLRSAAQAIRQAVSMKVHVISMSWTIIAPTNVENLGPEDRAALEDLEAAISEASRANILMFCSASDQGPVQSPTYPSKVTKRIFRIGAADAYGFVTKAVGDDNDVDFILPGKLVEDEREAEYDGNVARNTQYWTGSSVSTALASGLAALILYCAQIRISRAAPYSAEKSCALAHFETLKTHDGMMEAFRTIGTTAASKGKYLTVWNVFGKKVSEYEDAKRGMGLEFLEPIDLVADVATTLCAKF